MHEATLTVTAITSSTQPQTDDVSLISVALFGAVVPPFLATAAFTLVRWENFNLSESPLFLLFGALLLVPYLMLFCAPFGVPFALLCGTLARSWLRQGSTLTDVQARLAGIGAACGLAALWGVAILMGRLFDGKWVIAIVPEWPAAFWGAAAVVGGVCGWLLPRLTRIPCSRVA